MIRAAKKLNRKNNKDNINEGKKARDGKKRRK